jgi:hypothetical protein
MSTENRALFDLVNQNALWDFHVLIEQVWNIAYPAGYAAGQEDVASPEDECDTCYDARQFASQN